LTIRWFGKYHKSWSRTIIRYPVKLTLQPINRRRDKACLVSTTHELINPPMKHLPNLLIVDDTEENLAFLEAIIRKINVNLIQALSGPEALEKTKGIELALAILDVRMPGMNGYELARRINEARSGDKVPVIFLTANNGSEMDLYKGYSTGAVDYIFKPVHNHILLSKINVFLDLFKQKQVIIRDAEMLKESASDLIRVNADLKKSEEKYSELYDFAPTGYFTLSKDVIIEGINHSGAQILGKERSLLTGSHFGSFVSKNTMPSFRAFLERVFKSCSKEICEVILETEGNQQKYAHIEGTVVANGKQCLLNIVDITERKLAEKVLIDSELNLAEAQRYAHIGSWEWNMVTNTLKWSKEMFRVFDINPETFDGKFESAVKVLHPDDIEIFNDTMVRSSAGGNAPALEFRLIHQDGSIHTVIAGGRIEFDVDGKPYRSIGTVQDITKRKLVEDELKNSLEQLHKLTQYIEKVRENERVAISRELHDDLGQALTAVKIDLGIIKQMVSDVKVVFKIDKVSALVGDTIKTVQRLTSQLRPEIIDDLGLEAAIEWYTKEFAQRNGVQIFLDMDSGISISPEASLIIFRIMQESLTNIARHSGADRVDIGLSKTGEFVNFRISDNGVGISEDQIKSKKSFGIISMKERAASIGGTFEIYRESDYGTIIKLTFPLNKYSHENSDL
jgi:signal transduction histidine kinase/DNA-binding response OmpR family regulator